MKVAAIIAEYNPLHNGHEFQIKRAKQLTGADFVIVIMSGDFTQRGVPAVIDKYERTRMALNAGADLVFELPLYYSCSSAEYFASGAINLINKIGIVDYLVFGSECGDIKILTDIADVLNKRKSELSDVIHTLVKEGMSYPMARVRAVEEAIPNSYEHVEAMNYPNNILGFEYIRALKQFESNIIPITNLRIGAGYHDRMMDNPICSSLAIRSSLEETGKLERIRSQVPFHVYKILEEKYDKSFPVLNSDISSILKYKLLLDEGKGYEEYLDISPSFSDKIIKNLNKYESYSQFCELLKSKDITYVRVARNLLHILLNIRKESMKNYKENGYIFYARILGFKKSSDEVLSALKANSSIPIISKLADARHQLTPIGMEMLETDIQAAHIYDTIVSEKYNVPTVSEFSREIVII
ncbi:MAG: nucleotidyltransferase [Lachnospiraceae bacterium]|nr:nucleotidyltransferase [Lachnospiraceae bacterium]